jgi:hypothetical protein
MTGQTSNLAITFMDEGQGRKDLTFNAALDALDRAGGAQLVADFGTLVSPYTPVDPDPARRFLWLTAVGALSADAQIILPPARRVFLGENATTGGHNLVLKCAGQTGITLSPAAGVRHLLFCDGTDIRFMPGATPRDLAEIQAQWVMGAIVANGTFQFAYKARYGGTITTLNHVSTTGSFTVAVKINGTSVTGLSAVAVSSTPGTATASALNTFAAGDQITGVISSATGSPTDAVLNLNVTWA